MSTAAQFHRLRVLVKGQPVPQQRPRLSRGRVFDPSKAQKQRFLIKYLQAAGEKNCCAQDMTPLHIRLIFSFGRPKSHFRTGKFKGELKPSAPAEYRMLKTPDVDNLAKFVLDALNGTLYNDDKQVVALSTIKRFCHPNEPPSTLIDTACLCDADETASTTLLSEPCLTCADDALE